VVQTRKWQILAAVAAAFISVSAGAQEKPTLVGKQAPTFQLPVASAGTLANNPSNWSLSAAPARPTVLLFIATKCPISNAYNARMAQIAREFQAKGVDFIGINPNKSEPADEVVAHAKQHSLQFPILKDPGNKVADLYNAQVTPEVYVIDTKGVVRYHGRIDNSRNTANVKTQDLREALNDVLAGRAVRTAKTQAFGCTIKRVE